MFSDKLIAAIKAVSGAILPDMLDEDAGDASIVAEMVLDADRLLMFGYQEEQREAKRLFEKYGFDVVCKEAEKHVYTA